MGKRKATEELVSLRVQPSRTQGIVSEEPNLAESAGGP